jgi:leukotriene-A4 hydrolase
MSARRTGDDAGELSADGSVRTWRFEQPVVIPSYLFAIAVGEVEQRRLGPRCTVWAEPSVIEAAAHEFVDSDTFLDEAERLLGPYEWGVCDLLCLPPSFPYGGMENPNLIFVTPTLLAGDGSLADVVLHEICHSWTGNLLTCADWRCFWMNEGLTMMAQRKTLARLTAGGWRDSRLRGKTFYDFDAAGGMVDLEDNVNLFLKNDMPEFTKLVPDLGGHDPDDAFSKVPYEKGFALLDALQRAMGSEEVFEEWMRGLIAAFARKSLTEWDLVDHCCAFAAEEGREEVLVGVEVFDWEGWFTSTGMPPAPLPGSTSRVREGVAKVADLFIDAPSEVPAGAVRTWSSTERVCLLERLLARTTTLVAAGKRLSEELLEWIGEDTGFGSTRNAEERFRFAQLCVRNGHRTRGLRMAEEMLREQGRMKFVRPLMRTLLGDSAGLPLALYIFESIEAQLHPICATMVGADVGRASEPTDVVAATEPIGASPAERAEHFSPAIAIALLGGTPSSAREPVDGGRGETGDWMCKRNSREDVMNGLIQALRAARSDGEDEYDDDVDDEGEREEEEELGGSKGVTDGGDGVVVVLGPGEVANPLTEFGLVTMT